MFMQHFFDLLQGSDGNHVNWIKIDFIRDAGAFFARRRVAYPQSHSRPTSIRADCSGESGLRVEAGAKAWGTKSIIVISIYSIWFEFIGFACRGKVNPVETPDFWIF